MKQKKEKTRKTSEEIKREVRKNILGYVTAGLGLVAGLAWNDAITALIEAIIPGQSNTLIAKFLYAVLVTALVVVLGMTVGRLLREEKEGE